MLNYHIRPTDWEILNKDGLPLDCVDVMKFFNEGLDKNHWLYVPRQHKITEDEIRDLWIPGKDKGINYLASCIYVHMIMGSGTAFIDSDNIAELSLIVPKHSQKIGVGTAITKAIIKESSSRGITLSVHTSVENEPMQRLMKGLGYDSQKVLIKDYEKYRNKIKANSFDAYHYLIRP